MPVAGLVELVDLRWCSRQTKSVEARPTPVRSGKPACVACKEEKVCVATGAMAAMAWMTSSTWVREIADPEWRSAGKRRVYGLRGAFDRGEERRGSIAGVVGGSEAFVPGAPVRKRVGATEVSVVCRSDRDRLSSGERLGDACSDCDERQRGENPNHSNSMIAHGSP